MKKNRFLSFLTISLLFTLCMTSCAQKCKHVYVEEIIQPSCTAAGKEISTCSLCGYTIEITIPMTNHTYDAGKITVQPTYFSTGTVKYTCAQCGDQKQENIPKVSLGTKSYTQGTYKCPDDIPEGEYILVSSENMGYFSINADPMGNDILDNDNFGAVSHIRIVEDTYLELNRCVAVPYSSDISFDIVNNGFISGTYKVGKDIPAGTYKLTAFSGGYYCIQDKPQGEIVSNDFFDEGSSYITLRSGQYVTFRSVKIEIG